MASPASLSTRSSRARVQPIQGKIDLLFSLEQFKANSKLFRVYTVAVYFRGQRLAKDQGHSIQQAEMNAAKLALETCSHLLPHLTYQKRIMERSFIRQGVVTETIRETWYKENLKKRKELGLDASDDETEIKKEQIKEEIPDMTLETRETVMEDPGADGFEIPQQTTTSSVNPDPVQENLARMSSDNSSIITPLPPVAEVSHQNSELDCLMMETYISPNN